MYKYIVNNEEELKALITKILAKDKGAFVNYPNPWPFPFVVESNIKIKL